MANFWKVVNDVIEKSDILIVVADARIPESVNPEVLYKIEKSAKKYLIIYNKADLLSAEEKDDLNTHMQKEEYTMMLSAKEHDKTMKLLRRINGLARGNHVTVGIVGYPNTGKSSIINALKGRNSAPVSSQAGHTKGLQKVRVSQKVALLDSPGVIPYDERFSHAFQALLSARSPNQLKDPEAAAYGLLEYLQGRAESFYDVPVSADFDETLELIAEKLNLMKGGGQPDTKRTAVRILNDWQKGKMVVDKGE